MWKPRLLYRYRCWRLRHPPKRRYREAYKATREANGRLSRLVRQYGEEWNVYRLEIIKLNRAVVRRNKRIARLKAALDAAREVGGDD